MTINTTLTQKKIVVVVQGGIGPQGTDGVDGTDGVTPEFTVGTVQQLEPNEAPTVTITGTAANPVLNFGIPKSIAILG